MSVPADDPRLPVPVGEFGPLDVVSDLAYAAYVEGRSDDAMLAVHGGLVLTDAVDDVRTARYLRYIECLVLEQDGHWAELARRTTRHLDALGEDAGPYWRAKFLGLHSHALLQLGDSADAVAALAEGYGLVLDHPGTAYNRGSACHALCGPMTSALLFEPALALMATAVSLTAGSESAHVVVHDLALLRLVRGLLLELLGRDDDAFADYALAASLAVRAREGARERADDVTAVAADAALATAYQRMRCEPVDLGVLDRHRRELGTTRDTLLSTLALSSAWAREGRWDEARALCLEVAGHAERLGELVVGWVATAWVAQLDEAEQGSTAQTRRWRRLAVRQLEELVEDRAGRFDGLLEWRRVSELARRQDEAVTRLEEDPLTRVGNRRMLDAVLAEPAAARRPVAFVDIDDFKAVNDDLGHDVGDTVLVEVAAVLRRESRVGDVVVRYGGDEFVVLLTDGSDAGQFAARVHRALGAVDWPALGVHPAVRVSVGVSGGGPGSVERADEHLRRLKTHARSGPARRSARAARRHGRAGENDRVPLDVTPDAPA